MIATIISFVTFLVFTNIDFLVSLTQIYNYNYHWFLYVLNTDIVLLVIHILSQNTWGIWGAGESNMWTKFLFSCKFYINGLLGSELAYAAGAPARGALLAEGRCYAEIFTIVFNNIKLLVNSIRICRWWSFQLRENKSLLHTTVYL